MFTQGPGEGADLGPPKQDPAAGPLRDHRKEAEVPLGLARRSGTGRVRVVLARTVPRAAPYLDPAVCPPRPGLGHLHRTGAEFLWNPLDATNQGFPGLTQDRQPPRRSAPAREHEDGQHRSLPRRRARGRACHPGSGRNLSSGVAHFPGGPFLPFTTALDGAAQAAGPAIHCRCNIRIGACSNYEGRVDPPVKAEVTGSPDIA